MKKKKKSRTLRAHDNGREQKRDADDDELRADRRPGWCERCITIREINVEIWSWMNDTRRPGGTNRETNETRSSEEEDCAREEIVTGSINESSGEIVRWREYRRNKLDSELKRWVMKESSLEVVIGKQICECVCWVFVFYTIIANKTLFIFFEASFIESKT